LSHNDITLVSNDISYGSYYWLDTITSSARLVKVTNGVISAENIKEYIIDKTLRIYKTSRPLTANQITQIESELNTRSGSESSSAFKQGDIDSAFNTSRDYYKYTFESFKISNVFSSGAKERTNVFVDLESSKIINSTSISDPSLCTPALE